MGKRWYSPFVDFNGNTCEAAIYDSEYSGAAVEVNLSTDPVIINWMSQGDDKYSSMKPSECKLTMMSSASLQYLDVIAYSDLRFQCKITKSGAVVWQGYSSPESYSEPFIFPPYPTTITFNDGLGLLKNRQFTPPGYIESDWVQTTIWYIANALQQINFQLPIWTAIDLDYTSSGDGTVTARILEGMKIDWRAFRNDDGTFWTWAEVLDNILKSLQARIYLSGGKWWVENVDWKQDTYRIEKYTYIGVYDSTDSAADSVVALTGLNPSGNVIRFVNGTASIEISPGGYQLNVSQDYGHRENLFKFNNFDGNFNSDEFDAGGAPRYWTKAGDVVVKHDADENAILIESLVGDTPSANYIISNDVKIQDIEPAFFNTMITDWYNGKIRPHFKAKIRANIAGDLTLITNLVCHVKIILTVSGTVYHIAYHPDSVPPTDPWEWSTDPDTWMTFYLTYNNIGDWYEVDVPFDTPPAGLFGIEQSTFEWNVILGVPAISSTDPIGYEDGDGILYKGVQLYFEKLNQKDVDGKRKYIRTKKFSGSFRGKDVKKKEELKEIPAIQADGTYMRSEDYTLNDDNMSSPSDYLVNFGDSPNYSGVLTTGGQVTLNRYIFQDDSGYPINYFSRHGEGRQESLIFTVNREAFIQTYSESQIKLRGQIIDETDTLNFSSVLEDYDNRLYICIADSWNVVACTHDSEWHCIAPTFGEFNEDFSDDFYI